MSLHPVLDRFRGQFSDQRVREHTSVVIEGFPRSANTFAVYAFRSAQDENVSIASHIHLPLQVREGSRLHKPTLVLIREPTAAAVSLAVRNEPLTLRQCLRSYIVFYKSILSYQSTFVAATFDQVTSDFGKVTRRLNCKYGTRFIEFQHTPENVENVWRDVNLKYKEWNWSQDDVVKKSNYPSEERERFASSLKTEIRKPRYNKALSEAKRLFDTFVEISTPQNAEQKAI